MNKPVTRADFNAALDLIEQLHQQQSRLLRDKVNLASMNRALMAALVAMHKGADPIPAYEQVRDALRQRRPADFDPAAWGLAPMGGA
ncbi:MAG: hypothetical protein QM750_00110 [Rubrivivax sp.]